MVKFKVKLAKIPKIPEDLLRNVIYFVYPNILSAAFNLSKLDKSIFEKYGIKKKPVLRKVFVIDSIPVGTLKNNVCKLEVLIYNIYKSESEKYGYFQYFPEDNVSTISIWIPYDLKDYNSIDKYISDTKNMVIDTVEHELVHFIQYNTKESIGVNKRKKFTGDSDYNNWYEIKPYIKNSISEFLREYKFNNKNEFFSNLRDYINNSNFFSNLDSNIRKKIIKDFCIEVFRKQSWLS